MSALLSKAPLHGVCFVFCQILSHTHLLRRGRQNIRPVHERAAWYVILLCLFLSSIQPVLNLLSLDNPPLISTARSLLGWTLQAFSTTPHVWQPTCHCMPCTQQHQHIRCTHVCMANTPPRAYMLVPCGRHIHAPSLRSMPHI